MKYWKKRGGYLFFARSEGGATEFFAKFEGGATRFFAENLTKSSGPPPPIFNERTLSILDICVSHFHLLIENGCILILWDFWRPAMGSRVSWIPRLLKLSGDAGLNRLLGGGFKRKICHPILSANQREARNLGVVEIFHQPLMGEGGGGE